ncbi:keratin-associated protein 5-11 [Trichinella spiralis]|uniref:keratin-associated protein 5-11 n=1 Tax=Trichinella spiralis TaxID=6334 RepID=UPI0001EFD6F9|nr:keratin-associated protein 5-11 [Trichinella spiralis]
MITDQKHLDSKQSNNLGMKRKLLISAQAGYQICSKTKVPLNASYLAYEWSFDVEMRRRPPRCGSSIVKSLPNGELRVTALISGKCSSKCAACGENCCCCCCCSND